jgi:hypothetical protein
MARDAEIGHNFGAIVRLFRLETDVFSDKGVYGGCPFSMMYVSNRIHPQLPVVDSICVHSVLMDATRQALAAR